MPFPKIIIFFIFVFLLFACKRTPSIRTIAIQPILPYDSAALPVLRDDLTAFFHRPVLILPPITLPPSFLNHTKGERYSADSIIDYLTRHAPDSITQIVGFTHKDIYTDKRARTGHVLPPTDQRALPPSPRHAPSSTPQYVLPPSPQRVLPPSPQYVLSPTSQYAVWGIFGLAYCPGKASVLSNYRLWTTDESRYRHRLRTVLLHEVGHNLGLPHCPNPHCIMNDANETITTIDNAGDDFCADCRHRLTPSL